MKDGAVIEFKDKRRVVAAICTRVDASSVRLITEQNKEFNLPHNKIAHITAHLLNLSLSRSELLVHLTDIVKRIDAHQSGIELADLWELLAEEEDPRFDLQAMTEFYFGKEATSDQRSAMLRALSDDSLYFEQKNDDYLPKPAKVVEQIIQQRHLEHQKRQQRQDTVDWFRAFWTGGQAEQPAGAERYLDLLKELVVMQIRSERFNEAIELLREIGVSGHDAVEAAFALLVRLGVWDIDENLLLHEHRVPLHFSANVQEEARHIVTQGWSDPGERRDLRHLETFSIDDAETRDIDDALSVQVIPDGYIVGIHIADVSHFIRPETPLDREALNRITSIYLPDRKIEMLPGVLSHDACSLVAGQDRLAMSILVTFDSEDNLRQYEIVPSLIQVNRRLTYLEADTLIHHDAALAQLEDLAQKLQRSRVANGAFVFNMPELRIKVDAQKEIHLQKTEHDTSSQLLVSEMMVLANRLVAEFAVANGIPAIYRVQPAPDEPLVYSEAGYDPVLMARQRRLIKRSEASTRPNSHFGLGLKLYTQSTSPIRRYSDLITHRQLHHFLTHGRPFYTEEQLDRIVAACDQGLSMANLIQRYAHKYWLLKHLTTLIGQPTPALVIEVSDERWIVQLTDYLLEVPFYPTFDMRLRPGDTTDLLIEQVNPRRGTVSVRSTEPDPDDFM